MVIKRNNVQSGFKPHSWRSVAKGIAALALFVAPSVPLQAAEPTAPNWVRVTSESAWTPRDSQGEFVYNDKLWIAGGWFNSYEAPPRDVWFSSDGKTWTRATKKAGFRHSDLSMSIVFKDRMWMMGGWYNGRLPGHSASNQVWTSTDGAHWKQVTDEAEWSPRLAAALVEFQGKLWLLGGTENYYFGDESSVKSDVWSSADGKHWKLETAKAAWPPRAYHQAVVLNGKMFLFGGGNYVPEYKAFNDVWSSSDGVHWTQVTANAPWKPRLWFSAVVYRDRMFVLGGWHNHPSTNLGDVWYSTNGRDWHRLESEAIWKARHEHSAFVFDDKLWIAGGHARPLDNDVWSLDLPPDYFGK